MLWEIRRQMIRVTEMDDVVVCGTNWTWTYKNDNDVDTVVPLP